MARRQPPLLPAVPKQLSPVEIERGINRLQKRLDELESFDPGTIREKRPAELVGLATSIEAALSKTFGEKTPDWHRYEDAADLLWEPSVFIGGYETPFSDYKEAITRRVLNARIILREAINSLREDMEEAGSPETAMSARIEAPAVTTRRIFVVHGHDEAAKQTVARFLEKIGLNPVILHEQANAGQTIIEKFEKHSDVGFAVILLTPDDVGGTRGGKMQPRARQNVILELGYFLGRLTRKRVCALMSGTLEVPSDYAGVAYEAMDAAGAWKQTLARELQEAGYNIDWNLVMGR